MPWTKSQLNQKNEQLIKKIESRLDSAIRESQRIGIKQCQVDFSDNEEALYNILPYLQKDYSGVLIKIEHYEQSQREDYSSFNRIILDWS